jgi:hypothetical protein
MAISSQPRHFHPLPVIGHPEAFYVKHVRQAEAAGDVHARASHKVGQYVTLALDKQKSWEEKFELFCHALKRYCTAPENADEGLVTFYAKLGETVRRYAGQEAMRLARQEHDRYTLRAKSGESRETLAEEAEIFFPKLLGHCHGCPAWFNKEAWNQIRLLENQWI